MNAKQRHDIGRARLKRLTAREDKQPLRQGRAAIGGIIGVAGPAMQPLVRGFGLLLQKLEIAEDGGEQIVEVMRDAAGELADRFELLSLPQLRLGLLALGDGFAALFMRQGEQRL